MTAREDRLARAGRRRLLALTITAVTGAAVVAGCGGGSDHKGPNGAGGRQNGASRARTGGSGSRAGSVAAKSNGVSRRSATQIVAAAGQAIRTLSAVHVFGSVVDNGIPVRLDLSLVRGRGGEGRVSENGLAFRLVSDRQRLYILGSDAFWTHFGGATAAKLFHNKWLETRDAGEFASIGDLASISRLFGQLLTVHGKLAKTGRAVVSGQPAIGVVDRTQGGTLFVATSGRPYPLQIVKRGTNGGQVTFDDFNAPVKLVPPANPIALPNLG